MAMEFVVYERTGCSRNVLKRCYPKAQAVTGDVKSEVPLFSVIPPTGLTNMQILAATMFMWRDINNAMATAGKPEGKILMNGAVLLKGFRRTIGYCKQLDVHSPYATLREALHLFAYLCQLAAVLDMEKNDYVERMITYLLGLTNIAGCLIGKQDPGKGISLMERKQLTIGAGLVSKPNPLSFDEPTLGLDAQGTMASDCGYPIIDYFAELARKENLEKCAEKLADYTKQVANTLVHAYGAGILHRDISAGNSERQRGVFLNKSIEVIDDAKYGWKFLSSDIVATMRIRFFACSETYLAKLGRPKLAEGLKKVVDSMHGSLFQDKDSIYMGGKLGVKLDYECELDLEVACDFLDDDALSKLQSIQRNYAMQEMEVDTPSALPVPAAQTPAIQVPGAQLARLPATQTNIAKAPTQSFSWPNLTPARNTATSLQATGDHTKDNKDLNTRRTAIGERVGGHLDGNIYTVGYMVNTLGLDSEYKTFSDAIGKKFTELVNEILNPTPEEIKFTIDSSSRNTPERAMVKYFEFVLSKMYIFATKNICEDQYKATQYRYYDKQNTPVTGTNIKPDGLFCFMQTSASFATTHIVLEAKSAEYKTDIHSETLGQIGDYALSVWNDQPLRTFVPVLLLHGQRLDLLLFTRGKVVRITLGEITKTLDTLQSTIQIVQMEKTLKNLWFLLTLAPQKFGHICAVDGWQNRIIIKSENNSIFGISATDMPEQSNAISLTKRIRKSVNLFGRVAYLLRSKYKRNDNASEDDVVAKISWIPTNRYPERAAYDVLHRNNVEGVPKYYQYGVLKDSFFGYRMEILLLEDCGEPILDHLNSCKSKIGFYNCADNLAAYARKAASVLVHAYDAGVLHRDISAGNITVKGDKVFVIDWAYFKFINEDEAKEAAKKCDIDRTNILRHQDEHDQFTGTPLYMSIQTLCGSTMRGIIHDVESLFMVVLHTLAVLNDFKAISDPKYGWTFLGSDIMAVLRVGFFACSDTYLAKMGCSQTTNELKKVIDGMYMLLFQNKNGTYIGGKLGDKMDYEREFDLEVACDFLDDDALSKLQSIQRNYAMQEMEVDTPSALPVPAAQTPAIQVPGAQLARLPATQTNIAKAPVSVAKTNIPQLQKKKSSSLENEEASAQRPVTRSSRNSLTQPLSQLSSTRATSSTNTSVKRNSKVLAIQKARKTAPSLLSPLPAKANGPNSENSSTITRKRRRR
ncbi:ATP-binding cassette transporter snq2 [Coemansia sp. RSA 1358]|nr:ATP-binding cassette transporter snq2 [Coemansia sp. RSA 1358]